MHEQHSPAPSPAHWYDAARHHKSLGSTVARPGSLAGLAEARKAHLGQFYTPDALAAVLWRIAEPAMNAARARHPGSRVRLLDTSVGSGRLFQFADPARHTLAGADVHGPSIEALMAVTEAAGFEVDFVQAGMETLHPKGYGVALLNPPFGLHLDSPSLMPVPGTGYGRFGPHSAALSQVYAVEQALCAADVVLAILPRGTSQRWIEDPDRHDRLRAVVALPARSFAVEGTAVAVELVVFGSSRAPCAPVCMSMHDTEQALPDFDLACRNDADGHARPLSAATIDPTAPAIHLPVTGDRTVRVAHHGRRLVLRYACGLTQAKVHNALLRSPARAPEPTQRLPPSVRFAGQGVFDLELYLLQEAPERALSRLCERIRAAGGEPVVAAGVAQYLARRVRRHRREATPFRHVVPTAGTEVAEDARWQATVRKTRLLDPTRWGSPVFKQGTTVTVALREDTFEVIHPESGGVLRLSEKAFREGFEPVGAWPSLECSAWKVVHAGRRAAFPALAHAIERQMQAAGITAWLDREYQRQDVIELRMGRGGTLAWTMGLGKTRAALALALLGGQHSLIVLEPQLIEEFTDEIGRVGLDASQWQVIRTPAQCDRLRKVNIISYNRLRAPVSAGAGRRTYASRLRRRIGTLVADEGDVLTNHTSQQSRALAQVSPRRRYLMSGTPVRNLPRDILGVTAYTGGDGTALQPFGRHHPYAEPRLLASMDYAERGAEVFARRHVVMEWVTHEFIDTGLVGGAKREVPKVRNVDALRAFAAPLVLRRVQEEPDVARYLRVPPHTRTVTTLEMDRPHLAHYVTIADTFAQWYREQVRQATGSGQGVNLIALLARVGAVQRAATCPQYPTPGARPYTALTSKQRYLIERMRTLAAEGRKVLCCVEQPTMVTLLVRELAGHGVEAVPFHGQIPIAARVRAMNQRFRRGPAPVLIATKESIQSGYNIPQASYVLMGDRTWVCRTEEQCIYRTLRPDQTRAVEVEYVHLAGSIDQYQAQVLAMKQSAVGATVDFLAPPLQEQEFVHMDTILNRFVEALAERAGFDTTTAFREALREAA